MVIPAGLGPGIGPKIGTSMGVRPPSPTAPMLSMQEILGKKAEKTMGVTSEMYKLAAKKSAQKGAETGRKFMKAAAEAGATYGLSVLIMVIEKMGILTPTLEVLGALLEYLGGTIMIALMPLFERFVAIISDPKYLEMLTLWGTLIAYMLYPGLNAIVTLMELSRPTWDFWIMVLKLWNYDAAITAFWLGKLSEALIKFQPWILLAASGVLGAVIAITMLVNLIFGHSPGLIPAFQMATTAVRYLLSPLTAFRNLVNTFKFPTLAGGKGGKGGGGGGGGDWLKKTAKKAKKFLGLQEGTPYIPVTGWYHLHEGEEVISAGESGGGINITIQGDVMREELLEHLIYELSKRKALGII